MTRLEALQLGRARVALGWCQHLWAVDKDGREASIVRGREACRWCAAGAIADVGDDGPLLALRAALHLLSPDHFGVTDWNDDPSRTQAEVVALYDRAIEMEMAA